MKALRTISCLLVLLTGGSAAAFEYAQSPDLLGTLGARTGDGLALADDVPAEHAGQVVDEVTLYVAWWLGSWQAPDALIVGFHDSTCPPTGSPVQQFTIGWSEVAVAFYGSAGSFGVWEVTFALPSPVVLGANTTLAASVDYPWTGPPYLGFTVAVPPSGCEMYWSSGGWIPSSASPLGASADLPFVLRGPDGTAAPSLESDSWAGIRARYR